MRALWLAVAVAGCGGSGSSTAPLPSTTGLVVAIQYPGRDVHDLSISGATVLTARHFGPYVLAASTLPSGGTVGFVFDPSDAGDAMVCGTARDAIGMVDSTACDLFKVRAEQVMQGTLVLQETR